MWCDDTIAAGEPYLHAVGRRIGSVWLVILPSVGRIPIGLPTTSMATAGGDWPNRPAAVGRALRRWWSAGGVRSRIFITPLTTVAITAVDHELHAGGWAIARSACLARRARVVIRAPQTPGLINVWCNIDRAMRIHHAPH